MTSKRAKRLKAEAQQVAAKAEAVAVADSPALLMPKPVDGLDVVFGNIVNLPDEDSIPKEFWSYSNKWHEFVLAWFFGSLKALPPAKPGIDRMAAIAAIRACLASFAPSQEHKTAGCAYLCSLWLEEPKEWPA